MDAQELTKQIGAIISNLTEYVNVPVGISNKHIHLTEADFRQLFPGEEMTIKKMLNQPGEFASNQVVTVVGPRGELNNVRILGPYRSHSQVELAMTDARKIGLQLPVRLSGDTAGTPGVLLKSAKGQVQLSEGAIVAKRHIHMSEEDAALLKLKAGDAVNVRLQTEERSLVFEEVLIRIGKDFNLEMHIDTDEANAAGATPKTTGKIIKA